MKQIRIGSICGLFMDTGSV